jgi:LmbE family N-acetylglucosaminyl deacetylase
MISPETIVFVFPHQDDEMYIFHRIRALLKQGTQVFFVWMTDGAANNPEVRKMLMVKLFLPILAKETDERIRWIRAEESRSLAKYLDLPETQLRFLNYPSGQIKNLLPQIVESLAKLFQELQPQAIYTVAYEHGEFEHDVCHVAVRLAAQRIEKKVQLYEYPLVNNYKGRLRSHWLILWSGVVVKRTPFTQKEENDRIHLFIEKFPSQWSVARLEQVLNWFPSEYKREGEPYRLMPEYSYIQPIGNTAVMYQPPSMRFEDFREMVKKYKGSDML